MKYIFIVTITLFACGSCKKAETGTVEYLAFGKSYGFCIGPECVLSYKIEGEKIYPDTISRFTGQGMDIYSPIPLPNDKYLLAKELADNFPDYLHNHPGQTFGCPDCSDQGAIHLFIKKSGVVMSWHIDTNPNKQPVEIRPYVQRLSEILLQL